MQRTSLFQRPVITSISMDHMEFLGHTIEEIASAKAGIIKNGIPVVTMQQEQAVSDILREEAKQKMSLTLRRF